MIWRSCASLKETQLPWQTNEGVWSIDVITPVGKTAVIRRKSDSVSPTPLHIPRGLVCDWIWATAVRGWRLILWPMTRSCRNSEKYVMYILPLSVDWVKMEIVLSSETLLNFRLATQRHMLEESIFRSYQQEKIKSHKRKEVWLYNRI